jgi:hypothetical protein
LISDVLPEIKLNFKTKEVVVKWTEIYLCLFMW